MKFNKVLSFGCSFTEGGGLNTSWYQQWLNRNFPTRQAEFMRNYKLEYFNSRTYMYYYSYPSFLSKELGCEFINYGASCAGNDYILREVYNKCCGNGKGILVTIQPSLVNRKLIYDVFNSEEIRMNGVEDFHGQGKIDETIPVREYYRTYISYFYDWDSEQINLLQNINLIISYLESKNYTVIVLPYENFYKHGCWFNSKNICLVDNKPLSIAMRDNNMLLLDDIPESNDCHFSEKGNATIASRIKHHVNKYYGE